MKSILYPILCFLMLLSNMELQAQAPQGNFVEDSIAVGIPVDFVLTYSHDPALQVLFPDSTHNYAPFELLDKKYFPTITAEGQSRDSVIYTLTSFELEEIQKISLPISIAEETGTKVIYAPTDSIYMVPMLEALPDSVPLLTNTTMLLISTQFNYPVLLMILGGVMAVLLVALLLFGKRIRRYYRLKRLDKKHLSFGATFDQLVKEPNKKGNAEQALLLWKHYSGELLAQPLASYTTREIKKLIPGEALNQSLKLIDKAIYAGFDSEQLRESFGLLKTQAAEYYQKKVEEIKNE